MMLESLLAPDFIDAVSPVGTTEALVEAVAQRPEILQIRNGIYSGVVTEQEIRDFVSRLLGNFRRGERFSGDIPFCGLAAVLATVPTDYAEEFFSDMAAIDASELPASRRVAGVFGLQRSANFVQRETRTFRATHAVTEPAALRIDNSPFRLSSQERNPRPIDLRIRAA